MIRILNLKKPEEILERFAQLHVDKVGQEIMLPKACYFLIQIDSLNVPAANILKQELLSLGGDAALHWGACDFSVQETPCLLMGTHQHFLRLCKKLGAQPFGLKKVGSELKNALAKFLSIPPPLTIGPKSFDFSKGPYIMGILNVTPDSFSGDGLGYDLKKILKKAELLLEEGADLLDIGGESTRPGSTHVSYKEEQKRVIPAIKAMVKMFKIPISVDTSKAKVAQEALEAGAHLINDVTALLGDSNMVEVAKKYRAPVVVMHHQKSKNSDLLREVCKFFKERIETLEKEGISEEKIILDPGIGFEKSPKQNLYLQKRMKEFKIFGRPLLLGASRKSFIGQVLNEPVENRLSGSIASAVHGFLRGFHFFRVHDVRETRQALQLSKAILTAHE